HASYPCLSHDTATPETYPLSLHDALPICKEVDTGRQREQALVRLEADVRRLQEERHTLLGHVESMLKELARIDLAEEGVALLLRSEEHTSELQSLTNLVCRLLLEKKKHHS